MGLITRTLPPDDKGFKLTFSEMDNNLYYLQGLGVSGLSFNGDTLTITNPTGGTKTTKIETLSRTLIPSGTTITIEDNFQYFVFGDLVLQGVLNVKPNAEVVILNGNFIHSGGTLNNSGTTQIVTFPELNTFVTGATLNQVNDDVTFTGNFGFSSFTLDLSPLRFTGGTISGKTTFTGGLSATTLSATTIDLCSTNGTLYTDSISGCSPINFLSESLFQNGLTATTISGGTFYGDGSNLTGVTTQDVFVTGGTYSSGTATFTNNTGGTFNVTGFTSGGGVSGNYLPLSGGTVTGNTYFTQSVTATTFNGLGIGLGGNNSPTNVSVGVGSLIFNNSGYFNTSLGAYSLRSNTGGNSNTSIGYRSMFGNITGNKNVSIGHYSMHTNTSGSTNLGVGYQSLYSNITGNNNVALGYRTLYSNTTGNNNVALGVYSLRDNTTGYYNVALGMNTLVKNTTGIRNIALGDNALYNNETGNYNVALGISALGSNTAGSYNTALGYSVQSNDFSGSTILGAGATATGDNQLVIGSSAYPLGPVTVETSGSTKTLTVIINGVQEKILLA